MISEKFKISVRMSGMRAYEISHAAHIHPSTLSRLLNGAEFPKPQDPRVLAIGRVLGLTPEECFDTNMET